MNAELKSILLVEDDPNDVALAVGPTGDEADSAEVGEVAQHERNFSGKEP